jgi:hypothetical protein
MRWTHRVVALAYSLVLCVTAAAGEEPESPFLGVELADADSGAGARIVEVFDGTAAANIKLQAGDVITAIDDMPVANSALAIGQLAKMNPGDRVELSFMRDGERKETQVTLGVRPNYSLKLTQENPPRVGGGSFEGRGNGVLLEGDNLNYGGNFILHDGGKIIGDLFQGRAALLDIKVEDHAALEVTGKATLSGILYIRLGKTVLKEGNKFEVIRDAASIKGTFGKLMLPQLPEGLAWKIVYDDIPKGIDLDADGKHDVTLVVEKKPAP